MKKLLSLMLSLVLVCALAGCGKEQSATYVLTSTEEGIQTFTDTQSIKAKGDIVYEMVEVTSVDISIADEASKAFLTPYYDEYFNTLASNAPEGVTVNFTSGNDKYEITITIDLKAADLQELMDGGYLVSMDSDSKNVQAVSFSQTCSGLEAAGYILQE